jgi:hypothetical protein
VVDDGFTFLDVFWSMLWFMFLVAWIWLLISILSDIFRDTELSGWGKAAWTFFIIVLPWLGALVYLIARGKSMNERALRHAADQRQRFDQYVRETAATTAPAPSPAAEVAKLAELRTSGVITDEEFQSAKSKILAG